MKIAVYAFATTALFFRRLFDLPMVDVEWYVILPRGHFRHLFKDIEAQGKLCYLYGHFNEIYPHSPGNEMDCGEEGGLTLYEALLRDKNGYRRLSRDEQMRRAQTVEYVYEEFLKEMKPDAVLFPEIETVDAFILLGICQRLSIPTIRHVGMRFLGRSFLSDGSDESLPSYFGQWTDSDKTRAIEIVQKAKEGRWRDIAVASHLPRVEKVPPSLDQRSWWRVWKSLRLSLVDERYHAGEDSLLLSLKRYVLKGLNATRRFRFKVLSDSFFDIYSDHQDYPARFVYYPLHYTPESSINGIEPYFVDQFRVVDRLLLALPRGWILVVKEHPAMVGLRDRGFYKQIKKKPGVLLAHPACDSYRLIQKSSLVATVTGTVGLESYFLNHPCVMFGPSFFSHLCFPAPEFSRNRSFILEAVRKFKPPSEEEKIVALAQLLNISGDFRCGDPYADPVILSDENLYSFQESLRVHLNRLSSALPGKRLPR